MSVDLGHSAISGLIETVDQAGQAILDYYEGRKNAVVRVKQDGSPVTEADLAADDIVCAALGTTTPGIPVISEERFEGRFDLPPDRPFWLVDPLDGTREFVNRTGEFTVNIALIDNRRPVFGMVGVPTAGENICGQGGAGRMVYRPRRRSAADRRAQPPAGRIDRDLEPVAWQSQRLDRLAGGLSGVQPLSQGQLVQVL